MSSSTIAIIGATIGATTGAISLAYQWWSHRFKLVFERAVLRYEPDAVTQLRERPAKQLDDRFFDLEVEIELLNKASGRGSIEKPRLQVSLPDGTVIVQHPDTQERRSEPIGNHPGAYRIWVERFGNSYTIAPRERLDDALTYTIDFDHGERFLAFLQGFDVLTFTLLYRDHRGTERRRRIDECVGVDELI